jgi:hypothetical protein
VVAKVAGFKPRDTFRATTPNAEKPPEVKF